MVEENTRAAEHIICLAIFLYNPETILLCDCVWRIGMERSILILRHFLHLAIELRCGSLIDAAVFGETELAYSLKYTEHANSIDIGGKLR